jgi:hypothetical protein
VGDAENISYPHGKDRNTIVAKTESQDTSSVGVHRWNCSFYLLVGPGFADEYCPWWNGLKSGVDPVFWQLELGQGRLEQMPLKMH